jgi:endonuclease YncB( thermonuclease family)
MPAPLATVVRVLRIALVIVAAGALAGCALDDSDATAGASQRARVVEVTDGDTIDVEISGREKTIRLLGIDTPEVFFGEECGGAAASRSLARLLEPGDRVRLIGDRSQDNRDAYERLLRYVELRGRDVGRVQIRRGHAAVYVFEDPFKRVRSYERAEGKAEAASAGVWGACGGDFHLPL